jgi:hypothetical protein
MDGLSGMKIYQKYTIDTTYLPANYPTSLEFLIKGITNNIQNNEWTTTIESIAIPKNPFGSVLGEGAVGNASQGNNRGSSSVTTSCGPKQLINVPSTNNPISPIRINAIRKAFNATFKNGPAKPSGKCARFTYNHAYNYSQALKDKALSDGASLPAGGNANENTYWSNIIQLGYTKTEVGKNITKDELRNIINSTNWNIGDVVVYYGKGDTNISAVKYGHTQMYTGGYAQQGQNWTSDLKTNYGTGFVYNSSNINCWDLIIFRAPNI